MNYKKLLSIILLLGFFADAPYVLAATLYTDNFNARTLGTLLGQGTWARGYGSDDFTVENTVAFEGQAVKIIGVGAENILKTTGLSTVTDGQLFFYLRAEQTTGGTGIDLLDADYPNYTNQVGWLGFDGAGNVGYQDAGGFHALATQSTGKFYAMGIQWSSSTNLLRYSINGGNSWTAWVSPLQGTSAADINSFIWDVRVGTFYLDYLGQNPFVSPNWFFFFLNN